MIQRSFRRNKSGQVIVITSLIIALLILSTVVYVTEIIKQTPVALEGHQSPYLQLKQSLKNTLISALSNITQGGDSQILSEDIATLDRAFSEHFYEEILNVDYYLVDSNPYQGGVWVSSGQNSGVSSASVIVSMYSTGMSATSNATFSVVIKSEAILSGYYVQNGNSSALVTLNINMLNEGSPAQASDFHIYQQNTEVANYSLVNDSSGEYTVTFSAQLDQPGEPLSFSVSCVDSRGIIVRANAICPSS
jgi:hypothetical protein